MYFMLISMCFWLQVQKPQLVFVKWFQVHIIYIVKVKKMLVQNTCVCLTLYNVHVLGFVHEYFVMHVQYC